MQRALNCPATIHSQLALSPFDSSTFPSPPTLLNTSQYKRRIIIKIIQKIGSAFFFAVFFFSNIQLAGLLFGLAHSFDMFLNIFLEQGLGLLLLLLLAKSLSLSLKLTKRRRRWRSARQNKKPKLKRGVKMITTANWVSLTWKFASRVGEKCSSRSSSSSIFIYFSSFFFKTDRWWGGWNSPHPPAMRIALIYSQECVLCESSCCMYTLVLSSSWCQVGTHTIRADDSIVLKKKQME